ncbi:hypothetical protein ABW20_dc0103249 [Dactylellina cionopaga]|nr:hypothetical protein ABW20_dc0103249 [Dactylellina cionopaga]
MNSVLFPSREVEIELPQNAVSASEMAQIRSLLDGFVKQLRELKLEIKKLAGVLRKPMKPVWITRDWYTLDLEYLGEEFYPVYLLSASKYLQKELQPRDSGSDGHNFVYIQGAGDDHEGWARGLLPVTYWKHEEKLLQTSEAELSALIDTIVKSHPTKEHASLSRLSILGRAQGKIAICDLDTYEALIKSQTPITGAVVCSGSSSVLEESTEPSMGFSEYRTVIPSNKLGSKLLRSKLVEIVPFAEKLLTSDSLHPLVISCQTGNNMSVGIALALICRLFDDQGSWYQSLIR